MRVRALQVVSFRNLVPATLEPGPGFNVLVGDNGQGKTNLLEALYLAGTLRSFRTTHAAELIAWGAPEARVAARVERQGLERIYDIHLQPGRRAVKLDGKTPQRLSEYFGDFNVVLFAPEDLRVPRGSPAGRRRFLDRSVFNRHVGFLDDAQRYARAVRSRNVLLRDGAPAEELLAVYDEQLAVLGARIVAARRRYLAELEPRFTSAFEAITQTGVRATLEYLAGGATAVAGHDLEALADALRADLGGAKRRDLARRTTTVGPHVDELRFLLDGQPARAYASQGQLRALVLAWKTAEMRLLQDVHGDAPVLLLDDVSSELDPSRNRYLFDFLGALSCQCFVTTTHGQYVLASANRQNFRVFAGEIRPES